MADIITIDGAGRLVVPQALRRRLGLRKGSRLAAHERDGVLVLEPVPESCVPVEEDGLLIIGGKLVGPLADHRDLRDARARKLADSNDDT
jgi:AbrB family looped-hinge helix DNA binding protein